MGEWRHLFPLAEPRPEQARALDRAVAMVDQGEKYIIAELGTGVGKSAFAVCLARYIRSLGQEGDHFKPGAYVLTSQKTLQDQYVRDFSAQVSDLRSSQNFECTEGPGQNCGQTMRFHRHTKKDDKGPRSCKGCPYRSAKERFMTGPVGITNYSFFLSETVYAGELEPRELLVLDEAHNIESEMRRWATFLVDEEFATILGVEFPFGFSKPKTLSWLVEEYRPALQEHIIKLTDKVEQAEKKGIKSLGAMVDELDSLDRHVCTLNRLLGGSPSGQNASDKNYLIDWEDDDRKHRRLLRVQPIDAGPLALDLLYPYGRHVLLMSATVLDVRTFARSTGVPKEEAEENLILEPTPFEPSNYGIVYRPVGRMSKAHIKSTLPKMVKAIKRILRDHPKEKGIIHCSNYEVARALSQIGDRRLLVQLEAKDREEILKKHMRSSEPTVIVSPSMHEGLDLEGDLGRLQVICKVPFPNMGDPIVATKMDSDREWYAWCTARSIIQSVGRCVRNRDDWAKTYILDESFGRFMEEWLHMFPPHFMEMEIDES